jgi:hypothetical protein
MEHTAEAPGAHPLAPHVAAHVLSDADVRALLAAPEAGTGHPVDALQVVVDYRSFAPFCGIDSFVHRLHDAIGPARAAQLRLVILGNGIAELAQTETTPLVSLAAEVAELLFEIRRRADDHFERAPLALPPDDGSAIHFLPLQSVLDFFASQAAELPPGVHLLHAGPMCSPRELIAAVAEAAGIRTCDAAGATPPDAAAELAWQGVQHACELHQLGDDAARAARRAAGVQLHSLPTDAIDWRRRVPAIVQPLLERHGRQQAPALSALPGLLRKTAGDGRVRYLRCGSGPTALLLVNAFGLTLDVWHDLVQGLARDFTVLAIDRAAPEGAPASLATTYYGTPDSLDEYVVAVRTMLAAEGFASCHVASWCGGAKFAIELARALPQSIASLSLFSPSFAGAQGCAGSDSAFEASLNTMCKLVDRMPQSADGMAKSMMALMKKAAATAPADGAGTSVFELADAATLHWLHEPFGSAANMREYSAQLLRFREHQVGGGEPLALPVLLVTGQMDSMTCPVRARDICGGLGEVLQFELRGASHYFIHQNHRLVARLLLDFVRRGMHADAPHPRLRRIAGETASESLVSGEI